MFRFGSPFYAFMLAPLGVVAWRMLRRAAVRGILFSGIARLPRGRRSWRQAAAAAAPYMVLAGLALGIAALARPQTVLAISRRNADVIAIQMVVDVSGSMEALDMSVQTAGRTRLRTRLEAVKETFADFVQQRADDLIGLVTFGGYASTRAPLTTDHDALLHCLRGVEIPKPARDRTGQVVDDEEIKTAIGDGLATGIARLKDAKPASRIVVLLSDGESNTGIIKPEDAAAAARKLGIKIYTIGIGSNGQAPFKVRDGLGREAIQYGQVALDEALLKRIAAATGGRYFNVRDAEGLKKSMADIDRLEKTRVEQDVYRQYTELFAWFALPGFLLLTAGTALHMALTRRPA
jgi:Ca-activated chloride channel family protein